MAGEDFPNSLDNLSLIALHELSLKIRAASHNGWPAPETQPSDRDEEGDDLTNE
jgi:hypothetical protein